MTAVDLRVIERELPKYPEDEAGDEDCLCYYSLLVKQHSAES